MNTDEKLKTIVDEFGKLSFLLETGVKLHQTQHEPNIKTACFDAARETARKLWEQLDNLNANENV